MKNSEFIEGVITKYNFHEVCEIKAENNMPTFCYDGYENINGIYDQKESVYLWVIIENNRPIDVIYVGLIDKTTLKERNKLHQIGFKGKGNGGSKSGGNLKSGILNRKKNGKILIYLRKSQKIDSMGEFDVSIHHVEESALIKKFFKEGFILLNKQGIKKNNI